ncbi:MAG TPA: HD domain-containing protein [Nitrososphaerales archaeon]|nr:HD domain-containing protein [Nitrososphaerales archaeon]
MGLRTVAQIRDPVHGYINITEVERALIDSPPVQRLRRVHQLAGAYLVYPGAVHTRFEHVIGAMNVAGAIAQSVASRTDLGDDEIQEVRLAALLHDVGHGPFSHLFEEVLTAKTAINHEDMTRLVILKTGLKDILEAHGFSSGPMSEFAVGNRQRRPPFMNEIISGGLSADIMDYLPRDSYFTGVEYGRVDTRRIIDSLAVVDGHLGLEKAALGAYEAMLLARYEMFTNVYFHRTVRAAQLMLAYSMRLADDTLHLTDVSNIEDFLELTDEAVIQRLIALRGGSRSTRHARGLALDFRDRRLVKCVYERLMQRKDRVVEQLFEKDRVRNQVLMDISKKAGVDHMHVYLDVPTVPSVPYTPSREMPSSIAVVDRSGRRTSHRTVPIDDLPLVGSIAGFMNILRIYTRPEDRDPVYKATSELLGRDESLVRLPE